MNVTIRTALSSFFAGALLIIGAPDASAAKIKCWTNNEGIRECGNAVPPEYSQKGHEEVNKQGRTVSTQDRAKTPEEIEKQRLEQEEKDRLAKLEEEQANKDRVLLATFSTEEDLKLAHEGKVIALETGIKHTQALVAKLESSLKGLVETAAKQERSGKKIPQETRDDIARIKEQINENKNAVEEREGKKADLGKQFEAELARFRRLKAQN